MRPIRNTDPSIFRIVSIRTCEARLWMIPSRNLRKLLGGILARYQEIFRIEIYAYFFLTNHFHLLLRAPYGNLDEFCENLNREIARRMNWKLKREGRFWSRRYDDIPLGREEDLLEAFLYVTTNATRHGLIENSEEWPGLHSFSHAINEKDRVFSFTHYSATDGMPRTTQHTLKLSILPQMESLTRAERAIKLRELLGERIKMYKDERKANNQGFLGLEGVIAQEPGNVPINVSRSKRPSCYTTCKDTWIRFRKFVRERIAHYREASFDYRRGILDAVFPEFSFKPPLHRLPRIRPFTPIQMVTAKIPA